MAEPSAVPPAPSDDPSGDPADRVAERPRRDRVAAAAVVLIVAGLLLLAVNRFTAGGERHSYSADATAPSSVSLVSGKEYTISVPGGLRELAPVLPDPSALRCEIGPVGGAVSQLAVTPETSTTKATNQIARFVAPTGGQLAVTCAGLTTVFVDDAEDAGTDYAGLALLLGSIALTIGIPLLLSVLRRHFGELRPATGPTPA